MCDEINSSNGMLAVTKTSLESLIFFTFGATMDEKCLLDKIIEKAFFDATNQGAFNTSIPKEDHTRKEKANESKGQAIEALRNAITEYTKPKGENGYKKWHSDICNNVMHIYDTSGFGNEFSYGNAQKRDQGAFQHLLGFHSGPPDPLRRALFASAAGGSG